MSANVARPSCGCAGRITVERREQHMSLGNRAHFHARPQYRAALVRCFADVLGCAGPISLPARGNPDAILAFSFPDGGSISIDFIDDALDAEQARRSAWLELRSADASAMQRRVLDA